MPVALGFICRCHTSEVAIHPAGVASSSVSRLRGFRRSMSPFGFGQYVDPERFAGVVLAAAPCVTVNSNYGQASRGRARPGQTIVYTGQCVPESSHKRPCRPFSISFDSLRQCARRLLLVAVFCRCHSGKFWKWDVLCGHRFAQVNLDRSRFGLLVDDGNREGPLHCSHTTVRTLPFQSRPVPASWNATAATRCRRTGTGRRAHPLLSVFGCWTSMVLQLWRTFDPLDRSRPWRRRGVVAPGIPDPVGAGGVADGQV